MAAQYNAQEYIISKLTGKDSIGDNINSEEHKQSKYLQVFDDVQQYIVAEKLPELSEALKNNDSSLLRTLIEAYIAKKYPSIVADRDYYEDVLNKCIDDMTGYSFLSKYLARKDDIQEININSWDSVRVTWRNGKTEAVADKFHSPEHAKDVMQRILRNHGQFLDENVLYAVSYIDTDVRITILSYPLVDEQTGIVASIRFIHPAIFTINELEKYEVLTPQMSDLLQSFIKHGVSVCVAGSTGSGKTTLCNALLETVEPGTRLITLEGGTREYSLVRKDAQGNTLNDRVHLQTRLHKNADLNVDLQTLLDLVLKLDPTIIVVGEMVSEEAFIASEAARTGHTVMTTIHSNSAFDAYDRMRNLGKRKYDLDDDTMLKMMIDAYPVIVYINHYPDGQRRVKSIVEAHATESGIQFNELYKFEVTDNRVDELGNVITEGKYVKVNPVTSALRETMIDHGMRKSKADTL